MSGIVKIFRGELVKFPGTVLEQYNGIYLADLLIGKGPLFLPALFPHLRILAHHQITGIAGAALSGEQISHLLNFNVD